MSIIGQLPPLSIEVPLAIVLSVTLLALWLIDRWAHRHR